jgi:hypothetical protein
MSERCQRYVRSPTLRGWLGRNYRKGEMEKWGIVGETALTGKRHCRFDEVLPTAVPVLVV